MLQRGTALAAILALSLVLATCGGSAEEETSEEAPQHPRQRRQPIHLSRSPRPRRTRRKKDLAEDLRGKTFRLWDVYNMHEPDALKVFYSDDYWAEEVEEIRENMQPFKNLGLTFAAEETSAPMEIAPGKWETKHTARFDGGLVNMVLSTNNSGKTGCSRTQKPGRPHGAVRPLPSPAEYEGFAVVGDCFEIRHPAGIYSIEEGLADAPG